MHLITNPDQFFLKIFLPPDWSLSDNVSDWFSERLGPTWAQRLLEMACDWFKLVPVAKNGFSCLNILGYKLGPKSDWLPEVGPKHVVVGPNHVVRLGPKF